MTNLETFTQAYLVAALWASTDDNGEPLDLNHDVDDIAPETLESMKEDCATFYAAHESAILTDGAPLAEYWDGATESQRKAAMAGHDFWLTRCGHGAGFWDGDWPDSVSDELDEAARAYGNVDLYLGDDRQIWA